MNSIEKQLLNEPKRIVQNVITAVILLIFIMWSLTAVDLSNFTSNGLAIAKNILLGIVTPNTDLLFTFNTNGVPYLLVETMGYCKRNDQ